MRIKCSIFKTEKRFSIKTVVCESKNVSLATTGEINEDSYREQRHCKSKRLANKSFIYVKVETSNTVG